MHAFQREPFRVLRCDQREADQTTGVRRAPLVAAAALLCRRSVCTGTSEPANASNQLLTDWLDEA